jgi:hypothetical protein
MNRARFGSQQHLGVIKRTSELPRRVLLGNLRVSGHKKRPGSYGLQPFSILLYSEV